MINPNTVGTPQLGLFDENIQYARDLIAGGVALEGLRNFPAANYGDLGKAHPDDLYRAAWNQAVAALDHRAGVEVAEGGVWTEDNVPDDQSLVFNTSRGLVLLAGCGHAGLINTLEYARKFIRPAPVDAAIGGFHLYNATDEQLNWTADKLKEYQIVQILGAHCTGIESVYHLRQRLGLGRHDLSRRHLVHREWPDEWRLRFVDDRDPCHYHWRQ